MSNEIAVVAIADVKPERESEAKAAIHTCVDATRQEAGCLAYAAHSDLQTPSRFVFIERWASRAALAAHEQQPHFRTMAKLFESALGAPLRVLVLRELA